MCISQVNQELSLANHTIKRFWSATPSSSNTCISFCSELFSTAIKKATSCTRKRGCETLNCVRFVWGFWSFVCFCFPLLEYQNWRDRLDQCLPFTDKNSKWLGDSRWHHKSGLEWSPEPKGSPRSVCPSQHTAPRPQSGLAWGVLPQICFRNSSPSLYFSADIPIQTASPLT